MSVLTTRPATTISGSGDIEVVPAAGFPAVVLADDADDDQTYVRMDASGPDHVFWGFDEPTVPATAVVKAGRLRAKVRKVGTSPLVNWRMVDPSGSSGNIFGQRDRMTIASTTATTLTIMNDLVAGAHVDPTNIVVDVYVHAGATDDPSGALLLHALYFDTIIVVLPIADVIAPVQGSTITADTTPTVRWNTTLDADGGGQTHFEVKLFNSAQANPSAGSAVTESGITESGATSWTPIDALADGSWFVYVRVAQTVNGVLHWSAWGSGTATSFNSFTVSVNRPGVPTLTVTAESSSGRIRVNLDDNAGAATTSLFQVEVSDDGTDWAYLRTAVGSGLLTPTGGLATAYDYEAPIGALRYFRARAQHLYPEGSAASAWSSTVSTSWTSSLWWVKNLVDPALNMNVLPRSQPTTTRAGRMGLFQPLDAKYPVAVLDKRSSASGEIVFRFDTNAARGSFEALCDEASIVLIQAPATVVDWPDRFVALGDYERERVTERSNDLYSFDSVQWTEVSRP